MLRIDSGHTTLVLRENGCLESETPFVFLNNEDVCKIEFADDKEEVGVTSCQLPSPLRDIEVGHKSILRITRADAVHGSILCLADAKVIVTKKQPRLHRLCATLGGSITCTTHAKLGDCLGTVCIDAWSGGSVNVAAVVSPACNVTATNGASVYVGWSIQVDAVATTQGFIKIKGREKTRCHADETAQVLFTRLT